MGPGLAPGAFNGVLRLAHPLTRGVSSMRRFLAANTFGVEQHAAMLGDVRRTTLYCDAARAPRALRPRARPSGVEGEVVQLAGPLLLLPHRGQRGLLAPHSVESCSIHCAI